MMAVYRFPRRLVKGLVNRSLFRKHVHVAAEMMRHLRTAARWKAELTYRLTGQLVLPSAS